MDRHARDEGRPGDRRALAFRLPDDGAERHGGPDPPEGHAGDPDDADGDGRLDDGAVGRGGKVAAAAPGRDFACGDEGDKARPPHNRQILNHSNILRVLG